MATTDGKKTGGRQKGVTNKDLLPIRDAFKMLIENNLGKLQTDLDMLKPIERLKIISEFAKFCVPTLKAIDFTDNTAPQKEPVRIIFEKRK
jgi:hypothetical protein